MTAGRYEPGETLYADPTVKPEVGRWCVFFEADGQTAQIGKLIGHKRGGVSDLAARRRSGDAAR